MTDNAQTSVRGSRKRKLSPTLGRSSIGIGKSSDKFWRESTRELSQEWSLNTRTVSEGLDSSSERGSCRSIKSNSWFSIQVYPQKGTRPPNSRKTFLPPLITSPQNTMTDEQQPTEGGGNKLRAWRIRLFPTTSQKETLRQWFGTQRYIYNRSVALVREGMKPTQKELRAILLNSETNTLNDNEKWLNEYAYDLKDEAIRDFMKNYQSNMAKYKNDKKSFTLKFRSKKAPTQSLSVLKKKWNLAERSFYSSIFSPSKMAAAEPLPTVLTRDSRLLRTRLGRYFLIVPNDSEAKTKSATRGDFVFIDPGVRTFLTCYDSNENVVEVGRGAVVRLSGGSYKVDWRLFGTTRNAKTFKGPISGWVRESNT